MIDALFSLHAAQMHQHSPGRSAQAQESCPQPSNELGRRRLERRDAGLRSWVNGDHGGREGPICSVNSSSSTAAMTLWTKSPVAESWRSSSAARWHCFHVALGYLAWKAWRRRRRSRRSSKPPAQAWRRRHHEAGGARCTADAHRAVR